MKKYVMKPDELLVNSSFRTERNGDPDKSVLRVERSEGGPKGERSE